MPDEGLVGWMHKFLYKNFWKVEGLLDVDEFIQEGYLTYCKCRARYGVNLAPAHFMALYKRMLFTHVIDLAKARTKRSPEVCESDIHSDAFAEDYPDTCFFDRYSSTEVSESDVSAVIRVILDAPAEIRAVLELFITDTDNKAAQKHRKNLDGTRETSHQFFCRLTNQDPGMRNIVKRTKDYLRGRMMEA